MDPLSLTASAISIIQLTSELVKGARKLTKGVKNAPREVAELIDELTVFGVVLERLKSISHKAEDAESPDVSDDSAVGPSGKVSRLPMLHDMIKADAPLAVGFEELVVFKEKLMRVEPKIKKSFKWPFQKEEIIATVNRVRNLRFVLDTAIASDQL